MGAIEKIRVKKRVKIVEIRVMLKLVLILALVAAALAAPLGEVPRRPNPLAFHRTRGSYEGLLQFWTSGHEKEFCSRIRVTQALEQDKTDKDKRIRVTQAVEQDKTDKDKRIRVTQAVEQVKTDKSDKRINFAAFQMTRLYYEGLSPQEKEEFWGRVRRGNKADETKDSWQHHISIG